MKPIKTKIIVFAFLVIFACNNNQTKKNKNNTPQAKSELLSDSITNEKDRNLQNQLKIYEKLITKIVTTSPRYIHITKDLKKAVEKNGGTSYGLNLSVNQNSLSNSKIYEFTLYETYQERQLNTARFTFDPVKKQLYEYNVIEDTMKLIEFDKGLLVKLDSCFK